MELLSTQWFNLTIALTTLVLHLFLLCKQKVKKWLNIPYIAWMGLTVYFYIAVGISHVSAPEIQFELESSWLRTIGLVIAFSITIYRVVSLIKPTSKE